MLETQNAAAPLFRSGAKFLLAALTLVLAAWIIHVIVHPWHVPLVKLATCVKADGDLIGEGSSDFGACLRDSAKRFFDKDYAETKDLAKTFLTLLSALLVASVTFAEKVVDVHKARVLPLVSIVGCWLLMLLSIICTGAGIVTMSVAAGVSVYEPWADFEPLESHAVVLFFSACVAFLMSLFLLILAGAISLIDKRALAAEAPVSPISPPAP